MNDRNLSKFSGDSKFPTWLHRIAVNQSLMLLRRRGTNREVQYEENDGLVRDYPDPAPTPEQAYAHRQMRDQLRAAVSGMPRRAWGFHWPLPRPGCCGPASLSDRQCAGPCEPRG